MLTRKRSIDPPIHQTPRTLNCPAAAALLSWWCVRKHPHHNMKRRVFPSPRAPRHLGKATSDPHPPPQGRGRSPLPEGASRGFPAALWPCPRSCGGAFFGRPFWGHCGGWVGPAVVLKAALFPIPSPVARVPCMPRLGSELWLGEGRSDGPSFPMGGIRVITTAHPNIPSTSISMYSTCICMYKYTSLSGTHLHHHPHIRIHRTTIHTPQPSKTTRTPSPSSTARPTPGCSCSNPNPAPTSQTQQTQPRGVLLTWMSKGWPTRRCWPRARPRSRRGSRRWRRS